MSRKHHKTEGSIYPDHLNIQKISYFDHKIPNPEKEKPFVKLPISMYETNFDISLTNQFSFILLHLRNKSNKNIININIPDICIFYKESPYDIIYSDHGFIRGLKKEENSKIKLRETYQFFKNRWKTKNLPKDEPCFACFKDEEYLMLSETDMFITCRKFKNDPFFAKLKYLRNKLSISDQLIKVAFQSEKSQFIKLATQSLLGFKSQNQIKESLSQQMYLDFCNQKIALFLNYEHNIRLTKAIFYYGKNSNNEYFLMNITNIEYSNLTNSLKQRQKRQKQRQQDRNKILIMTKQKQLRYKQFENGPTVDKLQSQMTTKFEDIVKSLKIVTTNDKKIEEEKNQLAFKKLHPDFSKTYQQILTTKYFLKTKNQLFKTDGRKSLTKQSRFVMKFYNSVREDDHISAIRAKTQNIEGWKM